MVVLLWILDLLIPVVILIMGLVFKYKSPRKINMIYGYRTQRSMASQEAWDAAHRMGGQVWISVGAVMVGITVIVKLLSPIDEPPAVTMSLMGASMIAIFVPLIIIERRLKEMFDENGVSRSKETTK